MYESNTAWNPWDTCSSGKRCKDTIPLSCITGRIVCIPKFRGKPDTILYIIEKENGDARMQTKGGLIMKSS